MNSVQKLEALIANVPVSSRNFAQSLINQSKSRTLSDKQMFFVEKLLNEAIAVGSGEEPQNNRKSVDIGDMSGIVELFDRAKKNLKWPAVNLSVPGMEPVRINVAGEKARFPGTLNVCSVEKNYEGQRKFFGRVYKDGTFECHPSIEDKFQTLADRLVHFADDPAGVAAEHGRFTGHCCFCSLPLKDEKSTEVGYGPVCAKNFGLPWGKNS